MNGNLGIGDLTHGVSASGAWDYVEGLNTGAINNAIKTLQATNNVKSSLQQGWQGAADCQECCGRFYHLRSYGVCGSRNLQLHCHRSQG